MAMQAYKIKQKHRPHIANLFVEQPYFQVGLLRRNKQIVHRGCVGKQFDKLHLQNVEQKVQSKTVLRLALLHAPKYVNAFSEHAVRLLDANFRQLIEEIRPLLHAMQQSTRTLQNACTHLKENKDRTLTKLIPGCKRTLEEFVFRIKAMMVSNNCTDALQIANLKNRNLL
ncbi:fanconi anemia group D2 protein, partial [Trichinella spiralis]|uniref:fanconi anemia group D2 protein n=1 Tax=Trichinella spiralis TaxID=6334 RepID=UPI0001EFEBA4